VDAVWAVQKPTGRETRSGHTIAREAVAGTGFDALAAAHSRALAQVSADIAPDDPSGRRPKALVTERSCTKAAPAQ